VVDGYGVVKQLVVTRFFRARPPKNIHDSKAVSFPRPSADCVLPCLKCFQPVGWSRKTRVIAAYARPPRHLANAAIASAGALVA
jgi:hypothetical protein